MANPHLPWAGYFTFFEAQLIAPGLNISGATLVGTPVIAIGFNDRVGWTHTVNTYDGQDLYELIRVQSAHYGSLIRRPYGEPFFTNETVAVEDVMGLGGESM